VPVRRESTARIGRAGTDHLILKNEGLSCPRPLHYSGPQANV
jgi:hypothetical protein